MLLRQDAKKNWPRVLRSSKDVATFVSRMRGARRSAAQGIPLF